MFGLAAVSLWAKCRLHCAHVLAFLMLAFLVGTWADTASAQPTGGLPIHTVTFTDNYTDEERAAAMCAVNYWNEVLSTTDWNRYGFTGTIAFAKDPALDPGAAWGNSTQVTISGNTASNWNTARNTQLKTGISNLESLIIHELGHSLGINYYSTEFTVNADGTVTVGNIEPNGWADFLYTPGNIKLSNLSGQTFTITTGYTFRGENAMRVWGDGALIGVPVESLNLLDPAREGSTLIHPFTPFGNMNATYNAMTRPFFSEVELAIMADLGHDIDIGNYFGLSFYQTHAGTITVDNRDEEGNRVPFTLEGMYGIGLHLVAGGNTIVLDTDITTTGYAGAGIRIENSNNTVTINPNVRVNASGENGVGVLITHGNASSFLNQGRIDATGTGGTGVHVNLDGTRDLLSRFDNSGIINVGAGNNAILIDCVIGFYGYYPSQGTGINFMRGTTVVGNITSNLGGWQALTFGKLAGADGFAIDESDSGGGTFSGGLLDPISDPGSWLAAKLEHALASTTGQTPGFSGDPGDFEMLINGSIIGSYDFEFWGGRTVITQDLDIMNSWFWIGYGTERSTLELRGNVDTGVLTRGLVHVLPSGTLIAAGSGAGTTITASVQVYSGGVISPSMNTDDLGRLTIDGPFQMADGSTLRVDLGDGFDIAGINNSDRIIVIGENTVIPPDDPDDPDTVIYNTNIGAITIDLTTLFPGTFRLISAATEGALNYTQDSIDNTNVVANGVPITTPYGRKTVSPDDLIIANVLETHLHLTIVEISTTDNLTQNYHLTWTGAVDEIWDVGDVTDPGTENWRDDAAFAVWFQNGDAVTFGLSGTNVISIIDDGVTVGDMFVIGNGDWTFTGDIAGVETLISDISTGDTTLSTGGLTMAGTGTIILNGFNTFEGDISLEGGVKIVDDITHSRTIVGARLADLTNDVHTPYSLSTDGNIFVGTTGFAWLDLQNGGTAVAAQNIYIGGADDSDGRVTLGSMTILGDGDLPPEVFRSELISTGGGVYVGGDGTAGQEGTGWLGGTGIVRADNVRVYSTGILVPGSQFSMFDTLTIEGNLWMYAGSTLHINLGSDLLVEENSIKQNSSVEVTGAAVIAGIEGDGININLSSLVMDGTFFEGAFTLVSSQAGLIYSDNSATLLLRGREIPLTIGRWTVLDAQTINTGTELLLTLDGTVNNYFLYWTGEADGTSWDFVTENWWGFNPNSADPEEPETDTRFVDGDAVIFSDIFTDESNGTHIIAIDDTGESFADGNYVVVAEMLVTGSSDWIFTGGGILGDGALSTLRYIDEEGIEHMLNGAFTMAGTGAVTLLNDVEFRGGALIESGRLQIGNGGETGSINNDIENYGNVTFHRSDDIVFVHDISGTGSLTKRGAEALVLAGNNTYTGLTLIEEGAILFGDALNSVGAITLQEGTVLSGISTDVRIAADGVVRNNGGFIFDIAELTAGSVVNNVGTIGLMESLSVTSTLTNNQGFITGIGTLSVTDSLHNNSFNDNLGIIAGIGNLDAESVHNAGEMSVIGEFTVRSNLLNTTTGSIVEIDNLQARSIDNRGLMATIGTIDIGSDLLNTATGSIVDVENLLADSIDNRGVMAEIDTMTITGSLMNRTVNSAIVGVQTITAADIANAGYLVDIHRIESSTFLNQGVLVGIRNIDLGGTGTLDNENGTIIVGDVRFASGSSGNADWFFESVGTLRIDGDFNSTFGTFVIGIDAANSSTIEVAWTAFIDGGVVNIEILNPHNHNYIVNLPYRFLTTGEGLFVETELVPGRLDDPLFTAVLRHDATEYWVSIVRAVTYSGNGTTAGQRAMGRYLDQVGVYPGGDFRTVLSALDGMRAAAAIQEQLDRDAAREDTDTVATGYNKVSSVAMTDPLPRVLDQMGGPIYGTMTTASFQNTVLLHSSLANVLRRDYNTINTVNMYYGRGTPPSGNIWGMIYGYAGSSSHDGNINGYRQGLSGIMVGYDRVNEKHLRLGLFLSAANGSLSSDLQDRTYSTEFMLGHYFRKDTDHGYLLMHAGIGTHRYDTRRKISFSYFERDPIDSSYSNDTLGYFDRTARNQHSSFLATAHFEMGLRYRNRVLNLAPFVGLQCTGLLREGFTEHGAGSLNLTAKREDYHSVRTMLGMRFDSVPFRLHSGLASFYGNVALMYEFEADRRHTEFTAQFSDAGVLSGPKFTIHGNDPGRDWVQAGFGLNYDFNANMRGFAGYDAYANDRQVMHAANLGFIFQR